MLSQKICNEHIIDKILFNYNLLITEIYITVNELDITAALKKEEVTSSGRT